MITTAEVKRARTESSANLLRRFSKRVQTAGVLRRARGLKFATRAKSALKQKKEALGKIDRRVKYERLKKLGKIKDVVYKKSH